MQNMLIYALTIDDYGLRNLHERWRKPFVRRPEIWPLGTLLHRRHRSHPPDNRLPLLVRQLERFRV